MSPPDKVRFHPVTADKGQCDLLRQAWDGFTESASESFSDLQHAEETLGEIVSSGGLTYGISQICRDSSLAAGALRIAAPVLLVSTLSDLVRNYGQTRDGRDLGKFAFDSLITYAGSKAAECLAFPQVHIRFDNAENRFGTNVAEAQRLERQGNKSLFFETADARQRFPQFTGRQKTDVVVVGGGIGGLLTARELSARGFNCTLLEAERIASGTTGQGCSMVTRAPDRSYGTLKNQYGIDGCGKYIQELDSAHQTIKQLANEHPCDFKPYNSHSLTADDDHTYLKQEFDLLHQFDPNTSFVTGDQASQLFAPAKAAIVFQGEGSLNSRQLSLGLAQSGKFRVFEDSPVTSISIGHPGKPIQVHTADGVILTDKVVLATGRPASAFTHLDKHVLPVQCFASTAQMPNNLIGNFFDDRKPDYSYFRPVSDQEIFFGGSATYPSKGAEVMATNPSLQQRLQDIFPEAKMNRQWTGTIFIGMPDGLPIVEQHPQFSRLWNITGLGGSGLVNGQASASTLGKLLTGQIKPSENLFSVRRFQARLPRSTPGNT